MNWLTDEVFSLWTPLQIFHLKTRMSWHRYRHMKRDFRKKKLLTAQILLFTILVSWRSRETSKKPESERQTHLMKHHCDWQFAPARTSFCWGTLLSCWLQLERKSKWTDSTENQAAVHERWSKQSQMLSFNDRVYIDSVHQVCKIGKKKGVGLGFVRYLW